MRPSACRAFFFVLTLPGEAGRPSKGETEISKVTIARIGSGYRSSNALNNDFEIIEEAFNNTLSRDGTGPNQMEAELDMNSNRVINVGAPVEDYDLVRKIDIQPALDAAAAIDSILDEATEAAETAVEAAETTEALLATVAPEYSTTTAVQNLLVPLGVSTFRTRGFAAEADGGGALWASVPNTGPMLDGQITTNLGLRRWEMVPEAGRVQVAQFGAFPGLHLDEDTEALWNAFSTKPSVAHIRRIDFFISELKKHGVWQKLDALYVFAAQSTSDILVNWKDPSFNPLTVFAGTPRLIPGVGLRGGAVTCQLRGTVNMSAFPQFAQDNAHVGIGVHGKPVTGQSSDINASGGAGGFFIQLTDANAFNARMNDATTRAFTNVFTTRRLRHLERHGEHYIVSRSTSEGYSVDRSGYPFGQGTITDRSSTGVSSAPLNVYIHPDSNALDLTAKVTQFAHVGAALDAIDRKILYQHLRYLMKDIPALLDGEPSTQAWVDGPSQTPTQTRDRIQSAFEFAARKHVECHLDRGVYRTNRQLFVPSHSRVHGAGMWQTSIRPADDVPYLQNVVLLGWYDNRRTDIEIHDLMLDANWRRRTNDPGMITGPNGVTEIYANSATAACIANAERVLLRRVGAMNPYKHCFDITGTNYGRSQGTALIYVAEPSRFVRMEECWAYQGGDDNITTHQCSDVWITDTVSWSPQGSYIGENTNCFEIDEGSRNVFIRGCLGYGGICGLQIKGHSDSPAPYNITVSDCRFVNNINGIELRQTDWYGPASAAQTELDTIRAPDGTQYLSSGVSPTARNIVLSDIQVIAPCAVPDLGFARDPEGVPGIAVWVRAYEDVLINNLMISEGALDIGQDYWMAQPIPSTSAGVMRVYNGGRHTQINNLTITGFNYLDLGFYVPTGLDGPLHVRGFNCINGPRQAFYANADDVQLESFAIVRDREPSGEAASVAITMNGARNHLGMGRITGYDSKLSGSPAIVAVQKTGAFTPTVYGATTAGTSSGTKDGKYTKTGNQVTVNIRLSVSSYTGTGGTFIGNLPYPISTDPRNRAGAAVAYYNGMALPAGEVLIGQGMEGTNTIRLTTGDAATSNDPLIETETTADFDLYLTLVYFTDDPFPD